MALFAIAYEFCVHYYDFNRIAAYMLDYLQ